MAWIAGVLIVILIAGRSIAALVLEYAWWKEMGQLATWQSIIIYSIVPQAVAALIACAVLWVAHARALKVADTGLREQRLYARIATFVLLAVSVILAIATIDGWNIVRFYGAERAGIDQAGAWRDPVF